MYLEEKVATKMYILEKRLLQIIIIIIMNVTCIAHITNTKKVPVRLGKNKIKVVQNRNEHLCLIHTTNNNNDTQTRVSWRKGCYKNVHLRDSLLHNLYR